MKKFYIPTLLAVFFLSSFFSQGQVYTSISSNPTNLTFDDPNFWLGHVAPPNPCTGCTINIQSNVSLVQSGVSTANPNNTIFTVQTPAGAPASLGTGITLGTKFQPNVNGFVTGVRFYKAPPMGSSGHVGLLWQLTPTILLLGQVNFTNETAAGWQDATFSSPIPVNAGVNYMIAYFVPAADGFFEVDNAYFAASGVTNGHLTAIQDGVTFGPNGVFTQAATPTFPNTAACCGFSAPNQWADLDFNPVNLNDLVFNNSTIKVTGNTNININTYVELFNTNLVLGNDPTSTIYAKLNDQVDLNGSSQVILANDLTTVDATNLGLSTILGPHDDFFNPGVKSPGIFSIIPPDVNGYTYTWTLDEGGLGSSANQYQPSPGIFHYILSCNGNPPSPGAPNTCGDGLVFGPATTVADGVFGVVFMASAILPVDLVQFLANKNDDGSVKVIWSTAQEENSDYYDVERSGDQADWSSIGTVKAKGFSSTTSNYFLTDKSPLSGIGYYRLKMVDLNGKFVYSKTVTVTTENSSVPLVVYSNPFSDQIRLKVNLSRPQNLMMTVSDMQGKTYITQSYQAQSGDNFVNIQPSITSSGMYILKIQGDTYNQTIKLEKQ